MRPIQVGKQARGLYKPQAAGQKKNEKEDSINVRELKDILFVVQLQIFSFIKATLDEMDKYPEMKGHYLVMDNAPIHSSTDIGKYINSRGYRYVYLPPYSPELNPIEQFWSLVKSKVKRNKFLEKESLMTRIGEACDSLYLSDFKGFVSHSAKCFNKCLNKEKL
ncbi:hypothetical protein G6F62_011781 [Rhizopus arrhizus]|nr:hypothetical protein G6F66_010303 [Rhizopus arrhizus]KAG1319562.1 hypothetical protein G6F62_011781 [Rhizopus arrhizus]KAG1373360.1 hypothetical protein G6F61_010246 [Rhizopus arrhizus]KAG1394896.1 hypothetical protein G6F60_010572 [Rhizopus arrhizus]